MISKIDFKKQSYIDSRLIKRKMNFKNILKWMGMPFLTLSGYLFIPIGCCIPNPLFRMIMFDSNELEHPIHYCESTMVSSIGGLMGTCCCVFTCCGGCGKYSPENIL